MTSSRLASILLSQIHAAWDRDESIGLHARWAEKRDEYVGSSRRGPSGGVEAEDASNPIEVPLGFLHINTLIPTIFARDPVIDAYPPTDADAPNAPIWEGLINNTLPLIRFKQVIESCLKDCAVYGEGWKKYGWSGRTSPKQPSPVHPESNGTAPTPPASDFFSQALAAAGYLTQPGPTPRPSRNGKVLPTTGEASAQPLTHLLKDGPWVARFAPQDVVVDPWSPDRDPTQARFIALRLVKPLAEVRATPGYKVPADFKPIKSAAGGSEFLYTAGSVPTDTTTPNTRRDSSGIPLPGNPVTLWEVWVYDLYDEDQDGSTTHIHRRVITIIEGIEQPIRDVSWESLIGSDYIGYPIHRITFTDVPDEPPMSELEAPSTLQQAINHLASEALQNINRFARIGLVDEKALVDGEAALDRIRKGANGTVEKTKGSPKDVYAPIISPGNSPETYTMLNLLSEVYQLVSGLSENRKGEATARTATEARIIEGGTSIKIAHKEMRVRDFCEAGIMTLIALFKSFVNQEYVIRRVGTGGSISWQRFGPDNLREMPDIRIRFESTKVEDQQKQLQKYGAVIPLALQLKPLVPTLRLDLLVGQFMRVAGIENVSEVMGYPIGGNPREQQWQELLFLMAGLPVAPQRGEVHPMHMAVIDEFKNTPAWGMLTPDQQAWILAHYTAHGELVQEETGQQSTQIGGAQRTAQDDLAEITPESNSPANQSRRENNSSSLEPAALPGASNEY